MSVCREDDEMDVEMWGEDLGEWFNSNRKWVTDHVDFL